MVPSEQYQEWWARLTRTGNIAPIELGFSREHVRAVLGEPDDVSVALRGRQSAIWRYNNLEFHFDPDDDALRLIYQENEKGFAVLTLQRLID